MGNVNLKQKVFDYSHVKFVFIYVHLRNNPFLLLAFNQNRKGKRKWNAQLLNQEVLNNQFMFALFLTLRYVRVKEVHSPFQV